ncbi:MAG: hypothetical protein C0626_02090 [Arcobacter sp.]|uniref:LPXTG cell wall anchor domain-containing protein n=1 Tax=uncultured Arcobacter sp. TaxID=165434 RepID=UPI000CBDDA4B|nr:LPXTG cell wall anchor domain-containing protein [uncultured Arcobacter sp.]PLY11382.1 MAG: hypothetical protein C0626_02090 [Arcobacter sp.]
MGMFGGSSMSTSSIVSAIDFSPVMNIGDSNSADFEKRSEQSATVAPKLDESMTASASVGVGVGGDGSGGTASTSRLQNENIPTAGTSGNVFKDNPNLIYIVAGLAGVGVVSMMLVKKKKKK